PQLGAAAMEAALACAGAGPQDIDEGLMGCALPAGQGQAPARQAALAAGLPDSAPCATINKMCGSGMKALMLAHDSLIAGSAAMVLAGGMESMSGAPYLIPKARSGVRMGPVAIEDHMFLDGLEDAYDEGQLMGVFAEETAKKFGFSRKKQDAYAIESLKRALEADFAPEITPIAVNGETIETDQHPRTADPDKIPHLKPAFKDGGTVTAANSSSISDGAAALVLTSLAEAERRGLAPLARIVAHATHAQAPAWFTTAPAGAITKVLEKAGWEMADAGLFEINEAFAVVPMAAMKDLSLPHEKVNALGGACALGHPIGASGARIVVTLLNALQSRGLKKGVAALCIGGGEATAMAVELMT
ncbi:MAG TPA: acetyl-CoA C-acyltransferase, partial [Rhodospirillales bacterium]|nr:acetyl-CoA C-acyltransferase [Rhodospirillales bacterium]